SNLSRRAAGEAPGMSACPERLTLGRADQPASVHARVGCSRTLSKRASLQASRRSSPCSVSSFTLALVGCGSMRKARPLTLEARAAGLLLCLSADFLLEFDQDGPLVQRVAGKN